MAPLKIGPLKTKIEPWLKDAVLAVRRECRRAEREWKEDKLQVCFQLVRDKDKDFSIKKTAKDEKRKHLTDLVASRCLNPRLFCLRLPSPFSMPRRLTVLEPSSAVCEDFLHFFY